MTTLALARPASPAFARCLPIPALGSVPGRIMTQPEHAIWANLALWCDNAGLVKPNHWRRASGARDTVIAALTDWAGTEAGFRKIGLGVAIDLAEGDTYFEGDWESLLRERGQNPEVSHFAMRLWQNNGPWRLHIGSTLASIEKACPGLGSTALAAIRFASSRTLDIIDPARIFEIASFTYWMGEDNEKWAVEELAGEEIWFPVRADFDAYAPQWAWHPKSVLGERKLRQLARDGARSKRIRDVATACLAIERMCKHWDVPSGYTGLYGQEFVTACADLGWVEADTCLMTRVWDDYEQGLLQSEGYIEEYGIDTFEVSEAGFRNWLQQKTQWFALARQMETLIGLIGKEIK